MVWSVVGIPGVPSVKKAISHNTVEGLEVVIENVFLIVIVALTTALLNILQ